MRLHPLDDLSETTSAKSGDRGPGPAWPQRWRRLGAALCCFLFPLAGWAHEGKIVGTGFNPVALQSHLDPAQCVGGRAGDFPCFRVDLLSHLAIDEIGGGTGNDIWGWTDPVTGKEYAMMGRSSGTAFVDISDPRAPVYVGDLPTQSEPSSWRDMKVYEDHLYVVSEARDHGMQVFNLRRLKNVKTPPVSFRANAHYDGFHSAHNIAINEESGYAFVVGASDDRHGCRGGLHMIDLDNPQNPRFAGCFGADGYTHDTVCVMYRGPDPNHQGKEVCFSSNEDTVTIADVTSKRFPAMISRTGYQGVGYTHQGWLTEDHRYLMVGDELDEQALGHGSRTYIVDVRNLDSPRIGGVHTSPIRAIDHNMYVKGRDLYQANYRSGLRIYRLNNVAQGRINQVAYFDVYPPDDEPLFDGAWSVYPYYESGVITVSSIEGGLFVLFANLPGASQAPPPGPPPPAPGPPAPAPGPGPQGTLASQVTGVQTTTANCRNESTQQRLTVALSGRTAFDCGTSGLAIGSGERIRQDVFGSANSAAPTFEVSGLTPRRQECANLDTGERIVAENAQLTVRCGGLGVAIAPGQRVRLSVWGTVD